MIGCGAALTLPAPRCAVGSAINASFRQLGAVPGVSILVALQSSTGPAAYVDAFHHVWWGFTALGLAA